jgi:flagellar biosynthesis protein FlhA
MKMPMLPLLTLAAGFLLIAFMTGDTAEENETAQTASSAAVAPPEVGLEKLLSSDVLEIELGIDLIQLADTRQGGTLLADIGVVRKQLASEMGIVLPKIRIKDNLTLPQNRYRVLLQGNEVESGSVNPNALLAFDNGLATGPLEGHTIVGMAAESVMPQPAYWITPEHSQHAVAEGYQISKPTEMLTAQIKQLALEHAECLLTRDATRTLIDEVSKHSPSVVSELIPSGMSLAEVQQVLKMLVTEGISIRPLSLILETLGDHCSETKNRWRLNEKVRIRLGRHISAGLAGAGDRAIAAFTLSEELQDRIACGWHREHSEIRLDLPRQVVDSLARSVVNYANQMTANGMRPIILVQQHIRPVIAEMAVESKTDLFVLGTGEVVNANIEIVGEITAKQLGQEVPAAA